MTKKTIFAASMLAAAATAIYAASDRINITLDNVITSIFVDDVDKISFAKSDPAVQGYDLMKVAVKEGEDKEFDIAKITTMDYVTALPDFPGTMTVIPSYRCVTFDVKVDDPDLYYRIGVIQAEKLEGLTPNEWDDVIFKEELTSLENTAKEAGYSLGDFPTKEVFPFQDDFNGQWFGAVNYSYGLLPGKKYVAYVYAGTNSPAGVKQTHAFTKIPITLKNEEEQDIKFEIDADLHSNSLTVKANCPVSDVQYAVDMFSVEDVEANGLEVLVANAILLREQLVYNYGYSWDDVTFRGKGEKKYTNLRVGEKYYCVAYGLEFGVRNTKIVSKLFTIPSAEIVDNCTFDVTPTQKSPSEFDLTVKPSNSATRYTAILCESSALAEKTAEKIIADKIYYLTFTNTMDWSGNDKIYTGTQTLNTLKDVIDGKELKVDTEYTVLLFGVDSTGERTTEIKEVKCKPVSQQSEGITFNVEFGAFDASNSWNHYQPIKVTPSDPNAKYYCDKYKSSSTLLDKTDDEFIEYWTSFPSNTTKTGVYETKMAFSSWGTWDTYLIFVFGFDGEKTSELYLYSIDTADGTVTQLRGPGTPQGN